MKYTIYIKFKVKGIVNEKDIMKGIFKGMEGLLGAELEMRELQKEGEIGKIEIDLKKRSKITTGDIKITTDLDQAETTLIGAAMETIDRIGKIECEMEFERIEDVRANKRDYIIRKAKEIMRELNGDVKPNKKRKKKEELVVSF